MQVSHAGNLLLCFTAVHCLIRNSCILSIWQVTRVSLGCPSGFFALRALVREQTCRDAQLQAVKRILKTQIHSSSTFCQLNGGITFSIWGVGGHHIHLLGA